jgi:hypothetical protein
MTERRIGIAKNTAATAVATNRVRNENRVTIMCQFDAFRSVNVQDNWAGSLRANAIARYHQLIAHKFQNLRWTM